MKLYLLKHRRINGSNTSIKTNNKFKNSGGKITREPGPMKHGKTLIAFVEDPDGYKIELIDIESRNNKN